MREGGKALGVLREEVLKLELGVLGVVDLLQLLPGGVVCMCNDVSVKDRPYLI